jgi:biotin-(acetyl-CoA carboxylase) ligase
VGLSHIVSEYYHEGYAEDVDEDGNLLLKHDDGSLSTIAAGDVTLRE